MCIPPAEGSGEQWFDAMARLNERVRGEWLSMGMSDDYELAIQEYETLMPLLLGAGAAEPVP